jgi:tetratricopeptide (TPR) repeat protein
MRIPLICRYLLVRVFPVAVLASLLACASTDHSLEIVEGQPASFEDYADFGPRPDIPTQEDIFYLTDEQRAQFLAYFDSHEQAHVDPHRRITNYLQRFGKVFNYDGATLDARTTLGQRSGNCMSMAVLTTALSQVAGVEVGYQLVDSLPVFELDDDLAFKGQHVRSYLYDPSYSPDNAFMIIRRPGIIVDYFPSGREHFIGNVTEDEYVAMFYRNKAASALSDGNLNEAYWMLQESFVHAPDHADGINMMAVLHRRAGESQRAEELYQYGISIADQKVSLLKNYRNMLRSQGRMEEAEAIEETLHTLEDPSPFNWLSLAQEAYGQENYVLALRMYDKALEVAPYLKDAHMGKVRSQIKLGRMDDAVDSLNTLTEYVYEPEEKSMYVAKLTTLRHYIAEN